MSETHVFAFALVIIVMLGLWLALWWRGRQLRQGP
jgi:hypothetical protein